MMHPSGPLLGLALLLALAPAAPAAAPPRPNVLLIALDDLNDWVGYLGGHPDVRTPHLDALAARGLACTNAHVAAPVCNPSRVAMLTGLASTSTGIYTIPQYTRDAPRLKDAPAVLGEFDWGPCNSNKRDADSMVDIRNARWAAEKLNGSW